MADTVQRLPLKLQPASLDLDAKRFSYISDRTYSAKEVEVMTDLVTQLTPEVVKDAPNAKMFLRSLWFKAQQQQLVHQDDMHIYTVARYADRLIWSQ